MNRQDIFEWALDTYGTEAEYPWNDENAVLRHTANRKWYGVLLKVRRDKLGLDGSGEADVLNVKCDPLLLGSLLEQPGYFPAYHMSKDKWLSILLDGPAPDEEIKCLLDLSFDLTRSKVKRKPPCDSLTESKK